MAAMSLGSQISEGLMPLVDLIYPPRCPLCGAAIARQGGLCPACWDGISLLGDPSCSACNRPMRPDHFAEDMLCAPCLAQPPRHSGIAAAVLYNDAARQLILAFKHGGKIGLAPMLGRLIAARLVHDGGQSPLIVPVPLHRWRLWRRGYNQAALLAREIAKLGHGELAVDLLRRVKQTPPLGGLGRKARRRNLQGAIGIHPRHADLARGRDIILVDDVLTSGATSDACVNILLKHGAASVKIACFARVLQDDTPVSARL